MITALPLAAEGDSGGSFLVSPNLGLMIWTLLVFGFTMYVLSKVAFPRIQEALDKRANLIRDSIDEAEKTREEANTILEEYRARLKEAREQADDIVARARKTAETTTAEATEQGREKREELLVAARRDIEAETRRSLERIRKEVADLTVLTTEKVTRKSLDSDDQKRLIEEALAEVDFSSLEGNGSGEVTRGGGELAVEEIARVYARALFEAAKDQGKLDAIRDQLGQFVDALNENREMQLFLFSPSFSSAEKIEALKSAVTDAEPELLNFLELLLEKGRMPVIFRIRVSTTRSGKGEQAARRHGDERGRARSGDRPSGSARDRGADGEHGRAGEPRGPRILGGYAKALFEAAKDLGKLDTIRGQLGQFVDALHENREMQLFLFSPSFSSAEKIEALKSAVTDAEPEFLNFLELLLEKGRIPVIFRIQRQFNAMWDKENKRLGVTVTSAVELDPEVTKRISDEIEEQTGNTVELTSRVDPDILGGLVVQVGNMILDTSIQNRLEKLRKSVASAA